MEEAERKKRGAEGKQSNHTEAGKKREINTHAPAHMMYFHRRRASPSRYSPRFCPYIVNRFKRAVQFEMVSEMTFTAN